MASAPKKILVIRFSSIGDIVLTFPVLRSLKARWPDAELHFLTKKAYASLLHPHPLVEKVIPFEGDMGATVTELRKEGYEAILDLHRNIRSAIVKRRLGLPAYTYSKDRLAVHLYTRFRIGSLPAAHAVERYGRALAKMGVPLDGGGLEMYLPEEARQMAAEIRGRYFKGRPVAVALGGTFATKRWPREHHVQLLNALGLEVLLLGGPAEQEEAAWIAERLHVNVFNAAGAYDLLLSAALLEQCQFLVTHDTGLMHMAVALGVPLVSLWGNTVPALGFAPYKPKAAALIAEVEGLSCRPCSKLGHDACPKGHFKCMRDLRPEQVEAQIRAAGLLED